MKKKTPTYNIKRVYTRGRKFDLFDGQVMPLSLVSRPNSDKADLELLLITDEGKKRKIKRVGTIFDAGPGPFVAFTVNGEEYYMNIKTADGGHSEYF